MEKKRNAMSDVERAQLSRKLDEDLDLFIEELAKNKVFFKKIPMNIGN